MRGGEIPFYKMVASGNDFVVIDNRGGCVTNPPALARSLCRRNLGIGADGLLLLEASKKADYKIRIFNADGSEAEACGNGFRCVALLAHQRLSFLKNQRFESLSGVIEAEVKGTRVRVQLVNASGFRAGEKIRVHDRELGYYFVHTGVPHVAIFVEGLGALPVFELGRKVRSHTRFQPAGTNVNFVEVTGPQSLEVRTYERGVEGETLACGTGSAAAAVVSALVGYTDPPVRVKTRGGEILVVDFEKTREGARPVFLEGEAAMVFEGRCSV